MKIFISYRRKDSARDVGRIRDRLMAEFGEQSVFRDLVDIPVGVDFRTYLNEKTNECKVMLVVIGPIWTNITGTNGNKRLFDPIDYTRIEVETGLKRLKENEAIVIPVLVGGAQMPAQQEIPESIVDLTYQNGISINDDPYFDFDMGRLIRDLRNLQEDEIEVRHREYFEPETVFIRAGSFWMGNAPGTGVPAHELPQHEVILPAYHIGKYPVTNSQYEVFIRETSQIVPPNLRWDGQTVPAGFEKHPVSGVTWYEALAYCQWLSEKTGQRYSLPTEAQWEKACRGGQSCIYPWGGEFEPTRSNHGSPALASVDAYPPQNELGCSDLVGNIRQWTCTLWGEKRVTPDPRYCYPWKEDGRNDLNANSHIRRVMRGSSFKDDRTLLRCSARYGQVPDDRGVPGTRHGFRIAINI